MVLGGPEPFANVDVTGLTPEHRRVIEISRDQFRRYGHTDAKAIWTGSVVGAAIVCGRKGFLRALLTVTEDSMAYCHIPGRALLWSVYLRVPNVCRTRRFAFWVDKIDGQETDAKFGRIHPFIAYFSNPRDTAVPYTGLAVMYQGYRRIKAFKPVLESVGANLE